MPQYLINMIEQEKGTSTIIMSSNKKNFDDDTPADDNEISVFSHVVIMRFFSITWYLHALK